MRKVPPNMRPGRHRYKWGPESKSGRKIHFLLSFFVPRGIFSFAIPHGAFSLPQGTLSGSAIHLVVNSIHLGEIHLMSFAPFVVKG